MDNTAAGPTERTRVLNEAQEHVPHTCVLIYLEPIYSTCRNVRYLSELSGKPFIARLSERLRKGLAMPRTFVAIVGHEDWASERVSHILKDVTVWKASGDGIVSDLAAFSSAHPGIKTLLVFPGDAFVPDCHATRTMLEFHREKHSSVTVALELPIGLTPLIVDTKDLSGLARPPRTPFSYKDFWQFARNAYDSAPWISKGFTVFHFNPARQLQEPSTLWPDEILLRDRAIDRAAARAVTAAPEFFDSRQASIFDAEALAILSEDIPLRNGFPRPDRRVSTVLFSSLFLPYSGGEEGLLTLLLRLDRDRFLPVLASPFETVLTERAANAGIAIEISDCETKTLTPSNIRYWNSLLQHYSIDLVHVDGYANAALMVCAYMARIPLLNYWRSAFGSQFAPETHLADRVVSISDTVAQDCIGKSVARQKVVRIYDGVDLDRFNPELYDRQAIRSMMGISPDHKVLCMIARVAPDKRHWFLIRAANEARKAVPNLLLVLAGEAYDVAYRNRLIALCSELDMNRQTRWLGFRTEVEPIYAMADALVLCNTAEAFGRCIIEGLAMGLPAVVPRRAGPVEIVRDTEGLLYDPHSQEALTESIVKLFTEPGLRDRLAANARARAADFDLTRHVAQVESLYDRLLAEHDKREDSSAKGIGC